MPNLIVDKKDDSDSEEETFVTNKEEDDLMTPADEPMRPKVEDDEDHGTPCSFSSEVHFAERQSFDEIILLQGDW